MMISLPAKIHPSIALTVLKLPCVNNCCVHGIYRIKPCMHPDVDRYMLGYSPIRFNSTQHNNSTERPSACKSTVGVGTQLIGPKLSKGCRKGSIVHIVLVACSLAEFLYIALITGIRGSGDINLVQVHGPFGRWTTYIL
jgi:hypothetical protein